MLQTQVFNFMFCFCKPTKFNWRLFDEVLQTKVYCYIYYDSSTKRETGSFMNSVSLKSRWPTCCRCHTVCCVWRLTLQVSHGSWMKSYIKTHWAVSSCHHQYRPITSTLKESQIGSTLSRTLFYLLMCMFWAVFHIRDRKLFFYFH